MHLTRFTDYGLRTLIYLAAQADDRRVTINEVVEVYGLSRDHVIKVVHRLGQLGYIQTFRGKRGGFKLNHPLADINVGKVVEQMEPHFNIADCQGSQCRLNPNCRLQGVFQEAVTAFKQVLCQYSLADLVAKPRQVKQLLGL